MHAQLGVALIVVGGVLGAIVALVLRTSMPGPAVWAGLALAGLAVATGALLVQHGVTTADWVAGLFVLGAGTPVHVRLVFGRFGRSPTFAGAAVG
jgi:hypothetical protein